jgi:hypothetical protein
MDECEIDNDRLRTGQPQRATRPISDTRRAPLANKGNLNEIDNDGRRSGQSKRVRRKKSSSLPKRGMEFYDDACKLLGEFDTVCPQTAAVSTETAAVSTETAAVSTETAAVSTETAAVSTETAAVSTVTAFISDSTCLTIVAQEKDPMGLHFLLCSITMMPTMCRRWRCSEG